MQQRFGSFHCSFYPAQSITRHTRSTQKEFDPLFVFRRLRLQKDKKKSNPEETLKVHKAKRMKRLCRMQVVPRERKQEVSKFGKVEGTADEK